MHEEATLTQKKKQYFSMMHRAQDLVQLFYSKRTQKGLTIEPCAVEVFKVSEGISIMEYLPISQA